MKNRILMFHPTHKTAVNSVAGLFPDTSFELATVPEIPLGPREALATDGKLYPFEANARILGETWREVDENEYDLYITYPGMAAIVRRQWRIPGVLMFLNAEDPIHPGFCWYVANTFSTFEKLAAHGIPNRSHIFPTIGRKAVGDWTGEDKRAYFINDGSFADRAGVVWRPDSQNFLSGEVPFSRVPGLLPWGEYLEYRRKLRAYVELSNRAVSCMVLEAMMMGQPVVVPDMRDWNVIVRHGESGLLYGAIDRIPGLVRALISDDDLARAIGAGGRKRAEELAGDPVRKAAWTKIFAEVLR